MSLFKTAYDQTYYNSINERRPLQAQEIHNKARFVRRFKTSGTLLEIGCGQGKLLRELSKGFTVQGIDVSKFCVDATNSLIGNDTAKQLDLENGFPAGRYDAIIAFDVLEHLSDPKKTVQQAFEHLRRGGIFIFAVPNNFGLIGMLATKYFNFIDKTHVSTWRRKDWAALMNAFGDNTEEWDQIVYTFSHNPMAKFVAFDFVGIIHRS